MVTYLSTAEYLVNCSTIEAKIAALDVIITTQINTLLKASSNDDLLSYMMDDGQTKVMTQYKSVDQVVNGIMALEKLRNMYAKQLGRTSVFRLVDAKNLNGSYFGRSI